MYLYLCDAIYFVIIINYFSVTLFTNNAIAIHSILAFVNWVKSKEQNF